MNKRGKALVVSSVKGGVGKTVTCLNLAGIAKLMNKKIIIIDFDIYTGNIALCLNCKFVSNMYNLTQDIILNKYQNISDYVVKYDDNIYILPAPKDPRASLKIDLSYIETIVDICKSYYDLVIIDSTHILNELNIRLIDKVDELLLLMENDPMDVKNMKALLKILNNSDKIKYQVLLNNSCNPYKDYFTTYDIEKIIGHKLDYEIPNTFFLKNIDTFVMNGEIITLNNKMASTFSKEFALFTDIIHNLLTDNNQNEKGDEN